MRTSVAAALSFLVVFASTGGAMAQSASDQVTAEALFKQARDLMAAGKVGEACPKFAESQRLDPSAGTLLNLATCYERNGQLASAWVTFKEGATAAQRANEPDRAKLARHKVEELEPHLSTLTIVVPPATDRPDLVVKRDGESLGRAVWGIPIPVDPGPHAVEASAPGFKTWQSKAVVEGIEAKASIDVPALEAETPAPPPPPPSPPPPPPPTGNTQRALGLVGAGVGVAGVAAGSVFGLVAKSHVNDAGPHCTGTVCDASGISDLSDARHAATISTVGFIAGGVLLAGGIALYFTAPHAPANTGLVVAPGSAGSLAGLTLRGGW